MVLPTSDESLSDSDTLDGLTVAQVAQRLREEGTNALPGGPHRTWLNIMQDTAREPMFLLLAAGS